MKSKCNYIEDDIERVDGYTQKELMDEQRYDLQCELEGQIDDAIAECELEEECCNLNKNRG